MIPILYDKTGNTKITNLTDCIQCIVTEERNGMFEAELVYSVHSSNSDKLIRGNIIVADANDTLKEQKFRIYKITKPINGRIKILARHISFDMARDVVTGLVIDNQSCEYALNKLFSSSQFSQRFTGHSDIVNSQSTVINGTTHILKAIVGVEGSIIDTYGTSPEILRDNYDFYIYENRGHDNGVTIEYGKNLTGLNLDTDDSNMITRIRAIAKYRDENQEEVLVVSSPEFIDSPYINNYETPFIQEIDFSSHFKDDDIPTPMRLKTLAENYFANNKCDLPSENATISFIPLSKCVGYEGIQDKISLCDIVTVIDYRYNLTTKVKVIKVSYNTLKERYENMEVGEPRSRLGDIISNGMNTVKGEKGDKGDKGDKGEQGAPGDIGDFPDALPATPILTSSLYGFASIELSWTFESQPYYTYELYASKTQNFTPNEFDLLFEGKGSTFLFQAKPNETWYFRVRAVNSHGRTTNFSSQVTVTTTKIDDLSNYVENAAIGEALIGTLSLDRGWVGTLKGNYIDAKQLSVTDGNGKRTLFIDSFGNVSLDVTELKISSKKPATTDDIEDLENRFENNETYVDNLIVDLQNQLDGKIQTYSQSTDPSTSWTTTEKANHEGDIWYNTSTKNTYRWNGTSWILLQNAEAQSAKEIAQTKAQVFIGTPTTPYYRGDIWITSTEKGKGVVKTCITTRTNGNYTPSDWVENLKYTDDTFANKLQNELNNLVIGGRNLWVNGNFEQDISNKYNGKLYTQGNFEIVTLEEGNVTGFKKAFHSTSTSSRVGINFTRKDTLYSAELLGKTYTLSCWIKYNNVTVGANTWNTLNVFKMALAYMKEDGTISSVDYSCKGQFNGTSDWKRVSFKHTFASEGYVSAKTPFWIGLEASATGEFWVTGIQIEEGNKLTPWKPAPEDTESYVDNLVFDLQNQIDNKIETYSQSTDPSTNWTTTDEKNKHFGDIWYDTTSKTTYRWEGSLWTKLSSQEAIDASNLAKTKAQVFTGTPTTPYYKGDLWITALDGTGVVKTCIATRTSGGYIASDWVESLKYTDDTFVTRLQEELNNFTIGGRNLVKNSAFLYGTISWSFSTNVTLDNTKTFNGHPSCKSSQSGLTTNGWRGCKNYNLPSNPTDFKKGETYTFSCYYYVENKTNIDNGISLELKGKTLNSASETHINSVSVSTSNIVENNWTRISKTITLTQDYYNCYILAYVTRNGSVWFTDFKLEKGNKITDWTPAPEDTAEYIDNLAYDLQGQLDGKIETYSQSNDPSTSWTTTELKTKHSGDLWYNPNNSETKRWNGATWVLLENAEAKQASQLAQTKAQVFTGQPTIPYYKGDLWITALDGTGVVKTCIKDRISGNYTSSDWVESLKYTDDTFAKRLQEELNNVSIGGRNFIRNSAGNLNDTSYWSNCTLDTSEISTKGWNSFEITRNNYTSGKPRYQASQNIPLSVLALKEGEYVTLSGWIYVSSQVALSNGANNIALRNYVSTNNNDFEDICNFGYNNVPKDTWTYFEVTSKATKNTLDNPRLLVSIEQNGLIRVTKLKLEKGNKATDWIPCPEDTDTYIDNLVADLQNQLDGKIETYSQTNDPSTNWTTTELKTQHKGDIWYNTSSKSTYRWNGTAWEKLSNQEALDASNLASTKAQVFIAQPKTPYYKGDLWITALDGTGVVKTCITTRTSGGYTDSDWKETLKYTDDTFATQLQTKFNELAVGGINLLRNGSFENGLNNWTIHDTNSGGSNKSATSASGGQWIPTGKKALQIKGTSTTDRYGVQSTTMILIPNTKYTISGYCAGHRVDKLQINVRDLDNSSANIHTINITPVSGGATLNKWYRVETTFTTTSNTNYALNLYAVNFADNGFAWFEDFQLQQGTKATAWTPCPEDTDTYIDNLVADLQGQIDGKVQTYAQNTDPSTSWNTTELKTQHAGDIWYDTNNKTTYRWNGNSWVKLNNKEAEEASKLAQTKAQVFTSQPTPPYKKGDLWVTALDGTGVVKTCVKDRTSGSFVDNEWVENLKYTDNTLANKIQEELNNLSIGGRNLALNTSNEYSTPFTSFNGGENNCVSVAKVLTDGLSVGDTITIRLIYKYDNIVATDGQIAKAWIQGNGNVTQWSTGSFFGSAKKTLSGSGEIEFLYNGIINSEHLKNKHWNAQVRHDYVASGSIQYKMFKVEKGNRATDWTPAPEDTNTYIDNLVADLQGQLDGKIQTYSQSTDPSTNWTTTELKNEHLGDLWYNTSTFETKRWNGNSWVLLQNAEAQSAKELAKSKAQVFTTQPVVPYFKGDLWITALDGTGVVKTCITTRTSGSYTASEWVESLKYTDDTFATQLQEELNNISIGGINLLRNGSFENGLNSWTIQDMNSGGSNKSATSATGGDWIPVGKKALQIKGTSTTGRYGVQSTEMILIPNTKYTISGYCAGHRVNALQINVRDVDNASTNIHTINITPVSGGATLDKWYRVETTFTTTSNTRYALNLYAVNFGDNGYAWFEDFQIQQGNRATAWTPCPEDTDTYIDNLVADLQGQIDGKVQTYAQSTDPSTSWTTTELKNEHLGDIWYDTNNKVTYRWSGTAWVKLSDKEAEEASELASTKAQVFTAQPTIPYYKGDLWVTALDGTGIVKTCIKDRTSGSYTASEWVENLKYTDDTLAEQVQEELNNLSIGGRNYILNGKGDVKAGFFKNFSKVENGYGEHTLTSQKTYTSVGIASGFVLGCRDYEVGKQVTMSYDFMYTEWNFPSGSNRTEFWIGQRYNGPSSTSSVGAWRGVTRHNLPVVGENGCELNKWFHVERTMTIPEQAGEGIGTNSSIQFYNSNADVSASITFRIKNVKLEYGNRATDWTPAPEDTNNIINDAIKDLPTLEDVGDAKNNAIIASKIETIKQSYNILKSEYNRNIQQSEIIYKNTYLEGTAKTNLNTAITNYKTAFTSITSARDSIVNANTITTSQANAWNTAITNIQTSTNTLAKRVQEAQTYIDTAIYNASVDYTNQAIPDALTGYAKTSYVDDAMEQAVNDAKDGMVSSTDLTLNNTEILMSAASMGQYNLLRNSDFRNGLENWAKWGVTSPHTLSIVKTGNSVMNGENNACFSSLNATVGNLNIGFYQGVVLVQGSTYTLSYWVNCTNSTIRLFITSRDESDTSSTLAFKNYTNINGNRDRNTWKFDSITFVVPSDSAKIRVALSVSNCTNSLYNAYLVKPMLVSGNKAQAWTGHPDEIYVGVVSITEKKGLMVEHSNANTKTIMSANGFSIEDNNGDVLAWLSSKDQWTELKADKVFANNIENIYTGDTNLYVDHSKTIAGDGTSNKPFNSFAQLKTHLEENPIINMDVHVIVRDPGFVIHEQLHLERLKGTGFLEINLEGNLMIANNGNDTYCIKLHQIPKFVWIKSGRKLGSGTTGAVLCDGDNTGGHGIYATDVSKLQIEKFTIGCEDFGVHTERTQLYSYNMDFGKCYCAIGLYSMSMYYSVNDVGSCSEFVRLEEGSFAYWGCGTTRPQGSVLKTNGVFYDGGSSLAETSSTRYHVSNPTTPSNNQYYTKTFVHTSMQSYMYSNNSWSTDGSCKAGAWGYGLRGGHMFFNMSTIRSEMTGTIQDGNTITLTRANSGGISGDANVYINGSNCSSASGTPNYSNNTHLGTLRWGETKTFTLPKAIVQSLINGTCNSLAVYVNSTASNNYINITNASITLKTKK